MKKLSAFKMFNYTNGINIKLLEEKFKDYFSVESLLSPGTESLNRVHQEKDFVSEDEIYLNHYINEPQHSFQIKLESDSKVHIFNESNPPVPAPSTLPN